MRRNFFNLLKVFLFILLLGVAIITPLIYSLDFDKQVQKVSDIKLSNNSQSNYESKYSCTLLGTINCGSLFNTASSLDSLSSLLKLQSSISNSVFTNIPLSLPLDLNPAPNQNQTSFKDIFSTLTPTNTPNPISNPTPTSTSKLNPPITSTPTVIAYNSANQEIARYTCDGTDDQVEIQAAITAAKGGEIVLSAGTFHIGSIISTFTAGTTLSGAGSSTILQTMSANGIIYIGKSITDVTLRDLVLDGNSTGTGNGIQFTAPRTTLINIESKNWGKYGILANDSCTGSKIIGCVTHNNYGGIALENHPDNILVQNCTSYGNSMHGIGIGHGTNNTIDHCTSYSNKYNGILIGSGSTYNTISNNHCYANGRTGVKWGYNGICVFGPGNNYNKIINNVCEDNGSLEYEGHGISIDGDSTVMGITTGNLVQGNICRNNYGKGIEIANADATEIKDNHSYDNNLANLNPENSGIDLSYRVTHSIVTGNYCYDDKTSPLQKYGILERATLPSSNGKTPSDNGYNTVSNNTAYGNALDQIKITAATSTSTNNILSNPNP
jgi:hypothetical protein